MLEFLYTKWVVVDPSPTATIQISDIALVLKKEFLDIQVIAEYRFTLKRVCGIIKTEIFYACNNKFLHKFWYHKNI